MSAGCFIRTRSRAHILQIFLRGLTARRKRGASRIVRHHAVPQRFAPLVVFVFFISRRKTFFASGKLRPPSARTAFAVSDNCPFVLPNEYAATGPNASNPLSSPYKHPAQTQSLQTAYTLLHRKPPRAGAEDSSVSGRRQKSRRQPHAFRVRGLNFVKTRLH